MRFLIDDEVKFALGWNPKCGNTHLKKIWYYLHNDNNPVLHRYDDEYNRIRPIPRNYTILIVCRNPYERLVSGFLDRLQLGTIPRSQWPVNLGELTFEKYVNELVKENWDAVNKLHFQKQLSDQYTSTLCTYKNIHIQDLHSINYSLLEKVFKKIIPKDILTFRGSHQNKRIRCNYDSSNPAYKIPIDQFIDTVPLFENFYNQDIYGKVRNHYKDDLIFFKKYKLNYDIKYKVEPMNHKTHFTGIYNSKSWSGNGKFPVSGPGSSLLGTTSIRNELPGLCKKYNIQSIVDLGCGDLTWISTLEIFKTIQYTGVDIVEELIHQHQLNFPQHTFQCLNLVTDELPKGDAAILRDVIFHLQISDVKALLEKCKQYKYLFVTSNPCDSNTELQGRYTPRNLKLPPFNLSPIYEIPEKQWNREILIIKNG